MFPHTVHISSSAYNHRIEVREFAGEKYLNVDGVEQSGSDIQKMFEQSLELFPFPIDITSILVLGVGGGGVIKLLRLWFPDAYIDAVDIDEEMLTISQQYFGLSEYKNITFITADAKKFVAKHKKTYDLVIVDLYIGDRFPAFQISPAFYINLKKSLVPQGAVLMNFQGTDNYQEARDTLNHFIGKIFTTVRIKKLRRNQLYFLQ